MLDERKKYSSMDSPICSAVASEPLRLTKYLSVVDLSPSILRTEE